MISVNVIDMLAQPRIYEGRKVWLKLLFVFDEMDKMEVKEGQEALIRSLKNLFLRRHAVFVLVTSKEFYYMLMEDRKKEDSILGSYFSSVITVPMFTSANTQTLLEKLLADTSDLSGQEKVLISNLARYLTYRAHGLPREVVREIRSMQRWAPRLLQPYLTDRSVLLNAIQIYAQIQEVIENLNSRMESDSGEMDSPYMRERVWLSEGRQEQIRRGLYNLMEELLNAGSFTVDWNKKFTIYDANFSTVAYADFCNVFDQLALRLANLHLPDDINSTFFERISSDAPASTNLIAGSGATGIRSKTRRRNQASTGRQTAIRVLPAFYTLTGRQIAPEESTYKESTIGESGQEEMMRQVAELLDQGSMFQTQQALSLMSQYPNLSAPDEIQDQLFQWFISSGDLALRIDAGDHLSTEGFYRNANRNYPKDFLKDEIHESLLKRFVDLTSNGIADSDKKGLALRMLQDLIGRSFSGQEPLPALVFQDALLHIESLIIDDQNLAKETLKQVLQTPGLFETSSVPALEGNQSPGESSSRQIIPASLVAALASMAAKAGTNLSMALLDYKSYAQLDPKALNSVVSSLSAEQIVEVWQKAITNKSFPMSVDISAAALARLAIILPKNSNILQTWLNGGGWSQEDEKVLRAADQANPKLFYALEENIGRDSTGDAHQRLQRNQSKAQMYACKASQRNYQQALDRLKRAQRDLRAVAAFIAASITTVTTVQAIINFASDRLQMSEHVLQLAFQGYIIVFTLILVVGALRVRVAIERQAHARRDMEQSKKGILDYCPIDLWPKFEE